MKTFVFLLLVLLSGCSVHRLPNQRFSQYEYGKAYTFRDGGLEVSLDNPLHCPLRVWIKSEDGELSARLDAVNPVVLPPRTDTLLFFERAGALPSPVEFASRLGDTSQTIVSDQLELPFQKGKTYAIIQGNNSTPTHNTKFSRYAVDFGLSTGDTVCAATDGWVIGVVEDYRYGGEDPKWKPFSNFITIYTPRNGWFTQYVHLDHQGSFVEVGEQVRAGQSIGLSGMTGQTNIEHLHFNCLVPEHSYDGLRSVPVVFREGYSSTALQRNQLVKK